MELYQMTFVQSVFGIPIIISLFWFSFIDAFFGTNIVGAIFGW